MLRMVASCSRGTIKMCGHCPAAVPLAPSPAWLPRAAAEERELKAAQGKKHRMRKVIT